MENCPCKLAESADINFVQVKEVHNLTIKNDGKGSVYFSVLLAKSVQGSNATTIITLNNGAGYTKSNPFETSEHYTDDELQFVTIT